MVSKVLKRDILSSVISKAPNIIKCNPDTIKELALDKKAYLGVEEAADLLGEFENTDLDKKAEEVNLDTYKNIKLESELKIAAEIDRNKVKNISEKWNDLKEALSDLDQEFGSHFEFLLDEIVQVPGVNAEEVKKLIHTPLVIESFDTITEVLEKNS